MSIFQDYLAFFKGEKFSNGIKFYINSEAGRAELIDRIEYLEVVAKGKKIIHVGCVDHLPLIENKIKNKTWLHQRLCNVSSRCVGIDINLDGINYLKNNLGYEDVHYANILDCENFEKILGSDVFDYLVLGEILEHVNDPHQFLRTLNEKFNGKVNYIIITIPNAFAFDNFINNFKSIECINTDHRYWFSPFTISKLLILANFKMIELSLVELGYHRLNTFKNIIRYIKSPKRFFITKFPLFRDSIIAIAKL